MQPISMLLPRCLQNIRQSLNIIQLGLRLNPYHQDYYKLEEVNNKLKHQESLVAQLLYERTLAPPIISCSVVYSTALALGQLFSEDLSHDTLVLQFSENQQWANNSIRELNEQGIEEKQIRSLLISFRNILEEYTVQKSMKSKAANLLKQIL